MPQEAGTFDSDAIKPLIQLKISKKNYGRRCAPDETHPGEAAVSLCHCSGAIPLQQR
ncbi:MAG: hypothetical protein JW832_16760 [Deltaproteobacteria bacterium]|nr:hypothetical protein [Deltaproteobacteria bacterium]